MGGAGVGEAIPDVFAPRFADLGDRWFWRSEVSGSNAPGDYGPLEAIARNEINRQKIHTQ